MYIFEVDIFFPIKNYFCEEKRHYSLHCSSERRPICYHMVPYHTVWPPEASFVCHIDRQQRATSKLHVWSAYLYHNEQNTEKRSNLNLVFIHQNVCVLWKPFSSSLILFFLSNAGRFYHLQSKLNNFPTV